MFVYSIVTYLSRFPALLSSSDIAQVLGCSVTTAIQLCRDGEVPAAKVDGKWTISNDALLAHLLGARTPPLPRNQIPRRHELQRVS